MEPAEDRALQRSLRMGRPVERAVRAPDPVPVPVPVLVLVPPATMRNAAVKDFQMQLTATATHWWGDSSWFLPGSLGAALHIIYPVAIKV